MSLSDLVSLLSLAISLTSLLVVIILYRKLSKIPGIFRPSKNVKNPKAKRYIVVDVLSGGPISTDEIERGVREAVRLMFGQVWLDLANPRVVYYIEGKGIISTNRIGYKVVLASLPKVPEVTNRELLVVPRKTTGSIKKAKRLIGLG